ncbi:MAG: prolipoprotein diacylglyceryl transferase [Gammaproteobacteria bacterium]|nr:prolipoprotein diacylglyceryl transferase [Gammaproteobacteria bacterium]
MNYPQIDPVALDLGVIQIHWYGLMYVFAFLGGYWLAKRRIAAGRFPMQVDALSDFVGWVAIGVILGGRLGYVLFYQLERTIAEPLSAIAIWEGGMSFHGGLLGVITLTWWFAKKHRIAPLVLGDALAPLVPIGLGLGRLGNFIGGELWGRTTTLPWGMVFPNGGPLPRHPSQLYEFALEGVVLFVVVNLYARVPRRTGQVTGLFLLGYGVFRFSVEFVRAPDAHLGFIWLEWMTMGQVLTVPMMLIGGWLLVRKGKIDESVS